VVFRDSRWRRQLRVLESTIVASYALDVGGITDRKGQDRQPL
jgi:hypothetical protein